MANQLRDRERREFEQWVESEYPDMAEEFSKLPKTLIDFVEIHYSYFFEEFTEATRRENIVCCT